MGLIWWMRVVGGMYLILFVAATILRLPIRAEGPKGLLDQAAAGDPTARYAVDSWFVIGLYFLVIGGALWVASMVPSQAHTLVWTVLAFELAGVVVDIYKLRRGYDRKAPVAWLVVHSVIIASGLYLLGGA
jgi:hypothetical protein